MPYYFPFDLIMQMLPTSYQKKLQIPFNRTHKPEILNMKLQYVKPNQKYP